MKVSQILGSCHEGVTSCVLQNYRRCHPQVELLSLQGDCVWLQPKLESSSCFHAL